MGKPTITDSQPTLYCNLLEYVLNSMSLRGYGNRQLHIQGHSTNILKVCVCCMENMLMNLAHDYDISQLKEMPDTPQDERPSTSPPKQEPIPTLPPNDQPPTQPPKQNQANPEQPLQQLIAKNGSPYYYEVPYDEPKPASKEKHEKSKTSSPRRSEESSSESRSRQKRPLGGKRAGSRNRDSASSHRNDKNERHYDRNDRHNDRNRRHDYSRSDGLVKEEAYRKTKMCPQNERGQCRKGNDCNFAHSESELRGLPDFKKTKLCIAFKEGKCGKPSNQCKYAHGEGELRRAPKQSYDRQRQRKRSRSPRRHKDRQHRSEHRPVPPPPYPYGMPYLPPPHYVNPYAPPPMGMMNPNSYMRNPSYGGMGEMSGAGGFSGPYYPPQDYYGQHGHPGPMYYPQGPPPV